MNQHQHQARMWGAKSSLSVMIPEKTTVAKLLRNATVDTINRCLKLQVMEPCSCRQFRGPVLWSSIHHLRRLQWAHENHGEMKAGGLMSSHGMWPPAWASRCWHPCWKGMAPGWWDFKGTYSTFIQT